jgi:hypothetical protein
MQIASSIFWRLRRLSRAILLGALLGETSGDRGDVRTFNSPDSNGIS